MEEQKISKEILKGNEDFFDGMKEDFVQQRINAPRRIVGGILKKLETAPKAWMFFLAFLIAGASFFNGILFCSLLLLFVKTESDFLILLPYFFSIFLSFLIGIRLTIAIVKGCKARRRALSGK